MGARAVGGRRGAGRSGERTAAMVGGSATNEEGFLVQHLLRKGLDSRHVASEAAGWSFGEHARALARPALSAKVSDIDHADAILVLDTELVEEAPILDLRVRKAVRRNGARLVVASSRPSTLDPNAAAALRFAPGAAEAAVGALAAALGSPRAGSLDELAGRARASEGFRPGTRSTGATGPDAVRATADVLRDAGDVVVIWGSRVAGGERRGEAIEALLALAGALGVEDKDESGLIEIPSGTNGRGLREVGCTPRLEPGLADAPASGPPDPAALLLFESTLSESALARATSVIAFAAFHDEALDEHADVVFPAAVYAEKEGTVTHPDGRLQRVRQALGHPGDARAAWWVLAELCERVGAGLGLRQLPDGDRGDRRGGALLRRHHARGDRRPRRALAGARSSVGARRRPSLRPSRSPTRRPRRRACARRPPLSFWAGPETEHAPSLRFLATGATAELSVEDARAAGIDSGDEVRLSAGGESVTAVVVVRTGVPTGSLFLAGARLPDAPVEIVVAVVA